MSQIEVDLLGELNLFKDSGRVNPIINKYGGHANVKGEKRADSFYIDLMGKDELQLGEKAMIGFTFTFINHPKFRLKLIEGQILELNEGRRKVGEFKILKVINRKLK